MSIPRFSSIEQGVRFEQTADSHSKKVYLYDEFIGTLLFHEWEFKLELGPAIPLRLKLATSILMKAMEDETIQYQKDEDNKVFLANNARQALEAQGIKTDGMTNQKAVETYLIAPNEQRN